MSAAGRASALVSSGAAGEDLAGAALASGFAPPGAALLPCGERRCAGGLDGLAQAARPEKIYLPLWSSGEALAAVPAPSAAVTVWPGDRFSAGGFGVSVLWPAGREGYASPADALAYHFEAGETSFLTGPSGTLESEK